MIRFQILVLLVSTACAATEPIAVGHIDEKTSAAVIAQVNAAVKAKAPEVVLLINSSGGNLGEGLKLLNALRAAIASGVPTRCILRGQAASFAAILLEAGCVKRSMYLGSQLMFHEVYYGQFSAPKYTQQALQTAADDLEDDNQRIATMIAPRMGMTAKEYRAWIYGHDRYLDAAAALEMHAIDEVITP